jgi:hypothetical protein
MITRRQITGLVCPQYGFDNSLIVLHELDAIRTAAATWNGSQVSRKASKAGPLNKCKRFTDELLVEPKETYKYNSNIP